MNYLNLKIYASEYLQETLWQHKSLSILFQKLVAWCNITEAASKICSVNRVFWNRQPKSLKNTYEEIHFEKNFLHIFLKILTANFHLTTLRTIFLRAPSFIFGISLVSVSDLSSFATFYFTLILIFSWFLQINIYFSHIFS